MDELELYRCPICGNIITFLGSKKEAVVCCGRPMEKMVPNTVDGVEEKHVPVISVTGDKELSVQIGAVLHPMIPEHYIEWILCVTDQGVHIRYLEPHTEPTAVLHLARDESARSIYAYCNIHGLWIKRIR